MLVSNKTCLTKENNQHIIVVYQQGGKKVGKIKPRPRGTDCARVTTVIVTKSLRGSGTEEDPCRTVTQYWSFDGKLLNKRKNWR